MKLQILQVYCTFGWPSINNGFSTKWATATNECYWWVYILFSYYGDRRLNSLLHADNKQDK